METGTAVEPGTEISSWWASLKAIAANDYNLAAARYKPRLGDTVPNENAAELIRELIDVERDIQDGLAKLLAAVEGHS